MTKVWRAFIYRWWEVTVIFDLIKARLVDYFKSPLFYIAVIVSLASGIYGGVYCSYFKDEVGAVISCSADDMWMLTAIWAVIVLVAMCAGREFSDGTIRNKIAVGHTKANIFISEICVSSIITFIMYLLDIVPTAIGGWYFISEFPTSSAVKWFVNIFLAFELMSIFAVVITYLLAKRAVAVVAAFALHFVLYIIVGFTDGYYYSIGEPRYITYTDTIICEDGTIKEEENEYENGYYIEGFSKTLIQIGHIANPISGLEDAIHFGCISDKTKVEDYVLKQETNRKRNLDIDVIKMLAYCIATSCAGAYLFGKKDLK